MPPLDAVIIAVDSEVTEYALKDQCDAFEQHGIATRVFRVDAASNVEKLLAVMAQFEEMLDEQRRSSVRGKIGVMAWCRVDNPLRELPAATSADIDLVRLILFAYDLQTAQPNVPVSFLEGREELHEFMLFPHEVLPQYSPNQASKGNEDSSDARPRRLYTVEPGYPESPDYHHVIFDLPKEWDTRP